MFERFARVFFSHFCMINLVSDSSLKGNDSELPCQTGSQNKNKQKTSGVSHLHVLIG